MERFGIDEGRRTVRRRLKWALWLSIAIVIVFVLTIIAVTSTLKSDNATKKEQIATVKKILGWTSLGQISGGHLVKFREYNENFDAKSNWNNSADQLKYLCEDATDFLLFYNLKPEDNDSKEYLKLADRIIRKINETVFVSKKYSIISESSDYSLFSSLTRLLNTFQYVADDSYKETKALCHIEILKMVPEFNILYLEGAADEKRYLNNVEAIYTATAKLLTNYLNDTGLFKWDIERIGVIKILDMLFGILDRDEHKAKYFKSHGYYKRVYEFLKSL